MRWLKVSGQLKLDYYWILKPYFGLINDIIDVLTHFQPFSDPVSPLIDNFRHLRGLRQYFLDRLTNQDIFLDYTIPKKFDKSPRIHVKK